MSKAQATPPASDTLEVSIFGPGHGECIVVHVPNGPWFVVDSFRLKNGTPVAVEYLRTLGATNVDSFTISHWHRDHTGGAAEVIDAFPSLRFVALPGAVGNREYGAFVSGMVAGTFAGVAPRQVADMEAVLSILDRKRSIQRALATPNLALEPPGSSWLLRALSPSVDDVRADLATLAKLTPSYTGPKPHAFDVNEGCTVLCLEAGGMRVLLASDLHVGSSPTSGWQAIVSHFAPVLDASLVKVGHHGSKTAYHAPAWTNRPPLRKAAVTPFPARGSPLPRPDMLKTLRSHVDRLFVTAKARKGSSKAGLVPLRATPFTNYRTTMVGALDSTGHVRFRVDVAGTHSVELFGGAHEVT